MRENRVQKYTKNIHNRNNEWIQRNNETIEPGSPGSAQMMRLRWGLVRPMATADGAITCENAQRTTKYTILSSSLCFLLFSFLSSFFILYFTLLYTTLSPSLPLSSSCPTPILTKWANPSSTARRSTLNSSMYVAPAPTPSTSKVYYRLILT